MEMRGQFSERQLIRWGVSGWVTLFVAAGLWYMDQCVPVLVDFVSQSACSGLISAKPDLGAVAAVVAAAIAIGFPFGFVLSQVYFVLLWRLPCVVGGCVDWATVLEPGIRGQLKEKFGEEPPDKQTEKWKREYRQEDEVLVTAAWWWGISQKNERRDVWEGRDAYLATIYHTQGALIVGFLLTGIPYVALMILGMTVQTLALKKWLTFKWLTFPPEFWSSILLAIPVVMVLWGIVLYMGRKDTGSYHRKFIQYALHYFYSKGKSKKELGDSKLPHE